RPPDPGCSRGHARRTERAVAVFSGGLWGHRALAPPEARVGLVEIREARRAERPPFRRAGVVRRSRDWVSQTISYARVSDSTTARRRNAMNAETQHQQNGTRRPPVETPPEAWRDMEKEVECAGHEPAIPGYPQNGTRKPPDTRTPPPEVYADIPEPP